MNNTNPPHIQFIKKPVYTVMGLLSLLGDECVEVDTEISDPLITTLATRSLTSETLTLVVVYVNNTDENGDLKKVVRVGLKGMAGVDGRYVVYLMNNVDSNPFLIWRRAGSPVFPSRELRAEMRKAQVSTEFISRSFAVKELVQFCTTILINLICLFIDAVTFYNFCKIVVDLFID